MTKVTLIVVALCSSLFTFGQSETEDNGFVVDKIIAKVDNYIVIKSELERAYQDYLTNGGSAITGGQVSIPCYAGAKQAHACKG